MTRYITRYEVTLPLGNGGATLGRCKTLEAAREIAKDKDVNIFKSWYMVSSNGNKLRLKSERVN